MQQKTKNKVSQNKVKHFNTSRSVRTEARIWLKTIKDTGKKLKVEAPVKERDQQLLDLIKMDVLKIEQQIFSVQDNINIPMTTIINISFNKTPCHGN